jgi:membrane-associated protease RseP (regulator of RpoE activity)
MVDTGWRSALTLASPFVANQKLTTAAPKTVEAVTGMGIGGPTIDTIARMPSLKLGRYMVENFVANFSHAKGGVLSQGDFAGIIGAEILRRFKVTFDYPHHRMILETNAAFRAPYEFDMSGLFITSDGAAFKAFKVYNVIKDSPGAQAGIREGDVIAAIDDRPASDFTLEQIRQMFKENEGKEHKLTVKRDGTVVTTRLQLRRVI